MEWIIADEERSKLISFNFFNVLFETISKSNEPLVISCVAFSIRMDPHCIIKS